MSDREMSTAEFNEQLSELSVEHSGRRKTGIKQKWLDECSTEFLNHLKEHQIAPAHESPGRDRHDAQPQ